MRVGHLAKGLLLRGDTNVELVVLCADKPTLALLRKVVDLLPPALKQVAPENTYTVTINAAEAGLTVAGDGLTVLVQLTSPIMREQGNERNGRTSRCECGVYSTVAGFKLTCSMQSLIFFILWYFFFIVCNLFCFRRSCFLDFVREEDDVVGIVTSNEIRRYERCQ
jgi:hypothetical protein